MTCCGVGKVGGVRGSTVEKEERKVEKKSTRKMGRWWLGWGDNERVKRSCRVVLAKLTPHSPDQSRQVGR